MTLTAVSRHLSAVLFDTAMAPLEVLRLRRIRRRLISTASGAVLEVGAGTGANLPFYDPGLVASLTTTDVDDRRTVLDARALRVNPRLARRMDSARIDAQRLPFADGVFDTVVATLVFCSVPCAPCGFDEIARVLKPGGRYLFLEHVRPAHPRMAAAFDAINPVWNGISRGCNLNRDTLDTLATAGFRTETVDRDRNGVFVWGCATPPALSARESRSRD